VTQSALSHRISALERELGMELFRRLTRRLELTEAGEILAGGMRRALDEIVRAAAELRRERVAEPLTVSVLPSFAMRWLVPRLGRFKHRHPNVDIRILAEATVSNLRGGAADIGLRFGRGRYPDLHVVKLMDDVLFPVCSPDLVKRIGPIHLPAEIVRFPLLHDQAAENDGSGADWATWLVQVGGPDVPCKDGLRFNRADLMLEAAANGLGLALARRSLVLADLAAGRLVRALAHEAPAQFSYYLVCLPEVAEKPTVVALRNWLIEECEQTTREASTPPLRIVGRKPG
jgi:LysR family glycine cleavage system transcriptional activator